MGLGEGQSRQTLLFLIVYEEQARPGPITLTDEARQ